MHEKQLLLYLFLPLYVLCLDTKLKEIFISGAQNDAFERILPNKLMTYDFKLFCYLLLISTRRARGAPRRGWSPWR